MFSKIVNYFKGLLVLLPLFVVALGPVLVAADSYNFYIPIVVYNNSTTTYSYLPIIASINNTNLQALGYINSTGRDTRVEYSSTLPSMISSYNISFVGSTTGSSTTTDYYRLGYSPMRASFDIVPGYGGFITVNHSSSLLTSSNSSYATLMPGWSYRQQLPIYGGSSDQVNYQKKLRVYYGSGTSTAECVAQYTGSGGSDWINWNNIMQGQTFTAETTGTVTKVWLKLVRVGVCSASYMVGLSPIIDALPVGISASVNITASQVSTIPDWYELDLGAGVAVSQGIQYMVWVLGGGQGLSISSCLAWFYASGG